MKTARYEGDLQPLIDWVKQDYPDHMFSAHPRFDFPPEEFVSYAQDLQPEGHTYLKFWASIVKPGDEKKGTSRDGWLGGFPHVHAWEGDMFTMITYLDVAAVGGDLGVGGLNKEDPYTFITPECRLSVFVDGNTWHGVKLVSSGERIAIIVTGFPPGHKAQELDKLAGRIKA